MYPKKKAFHAFYYSNAGLTILIKTKHRHLIYTTNCKYLEMKFFFLFPKFYASERENKKLYYFPKDSIQKNILIVKITKIGWSVCLYKVGLLFSSIQRIKDKCEEHLYVYIHIYRSTDNPKFCIENLVSSVFFDSIVPITIFFSLLGNRHS